MFHQLFSTFARKCSAALGSAWVFFTATGLVVLWFIGGFLGGFGDSYQLLMNTGTTICTFLMVFVIQNTQNRETRAMNLKLDELALAVREAKNKVVAAETKDDAVLQEIEDDHNKRVTSTTDFT
jgi:low affinity Fe/Cu permease